MTAAARDAAEPEETAEPADARPPRRRLLPPRAELAGWAGLLAVLGLMAGLVLHTIAENPKFSYLDEVAHADYLFQARHGGMAQLGERLGPEAVKEQACRGIDRFPEPVKPPCPGDGDPAELTRGWDVTNVDIHPPTYYLVTAQLARAILLVAPTDSLVTAGRAANILWFAAGLLLLYLAMRDLGARVPARLAVCLLVAVSPAMIQHMSLVAATAAALPAGALLFLAVIRWEQRRWNMLVLALIAAGGLWLKADNLVPVFVACLYLLLRAVVLRVSRDPAPVPARPGRPPVLPAVGRGGAWKRYLAASVLVGVAAVAAEIGWLALRNAVALGGPLSNPATTIFLRDEIRIDDLVSQLAALALPLGAIVPQLPLMAMAGFLLIGGCLAAVFSRRFTDPLHTWGVAALAGAVLGGPLLVIGTFISSEQIFPIPGRYGFGLIPAMAMLLGVAIGTRAGPAVLAALVGLFLVLGPVEPPGRTDGGPGPAPVEPRNATPPAPTPSATTTP